MSAVRSFWYFLFTSPEESCCPVVVFVFFLILLLSLLRGGGSDVESETEEPKPVLRPRRGAEQTVRRNVAVVAEKKSLSTHSNKMHVCTESAPLFVATNFRLRLLPPSFSFCGLAWPPAKA